MLGATGALDERKTIDELLDFWTSLEISQWFRVSAELDAEIVRRFLPLVLLAGTGALDHWQESPRGAAALVLLLDQFPRNLFLRSSAAAAAASCTTAATADAAGDPRARAYAYDARALEIVRRAIERGFDARELPATLSGVAPMQEKERLVFYMPLMHAEELEAQELGVRCFEALGAEYARSFAHFAREHRDVIARFGRFPSRNEVLGRESTPEEAAFLLAHPGW